MSHLPPPSAGIPVRNPAPISKTFSGLRGLISGDRRLYKRNIFIPLPPRNLVRIDFGINFSVIFPVDKSIKANFLFQTIIIHLYLLNSQRLESLIFLLQWEFVPTIVPKVKFEGTVLVVITKKFKVIYFLFKASIRFKYINEKLIINK